MIALVVIRIPLHNKIVNTGQAVLAVGLLQSGGVVDPIAGHGNDVPTGLQGFSDAEFVLRGHLATTVPS